MDETLIAATDKQTNKHLENTARVLSIYASSVWIG
jgi:hypothetical protein